MLPPALWGWEPWGGRALPPPLTLCVCVEWENETRPYSAPSVFLWRGVKGQPRPCLRFGGTWHPSVSHPFSFPNVELGAVTGRQKPLHPCGCSGVCLAPDCQMQNGVLGAGKSGCWWVFSPYSRAKKKNGGRIWGSKDGAGQRGASSGLLCPTKLPAERYQMGASLLCFSQVGVNAARFQHSWHEEKLVGVLVHPAVSLLVGFLISLVCIFCCPNTCWCGQRCTR